MKPAQTKFPVIDYNYRAAVDELKSRCIARNVRSWQFSREYFDGEARQDFLVDAAVFAATALTVTTAILSAVVAVIRLFQVLPPV
jgi:hypothetical protein